MSARLAIAVALTASWPAPSAVWARQERAAGQTAGGAAGVSRTAPAAAIVGTAWDATNKPIAFARLRLRNVVNGRIAAASVADEAGRFTFAGIDGGPYLVELVSADGTVLAVGHAFLVGRSETVATFVRLEPREPWSSGFWSNAALAAASTAASTGITALAPVQRRISPDRP